MTATVADPAVAIAAAVHDFRGQLTELLDAHRDDEPGLLDEVGKLLGQARRKVNRAKKAAEEPLPAGPTAPTLSPAAASASTEPARPAPVFVPASTPPRSQPVTVPLPSATPQRRPARPGVPMSQPQQPNRPRTATPTQRRRRWVWFWVVVILLVSLGMAVAGIVIMAAGSDEPADPGSRPTTTRAFPPAAKPCAEVLQPGLILEQDTVGWGCLNEEGSRISAGSYVCADGRWLLVSMLLYQVWGYVGEPLRPVGTTSDPALSRALARCGVTEPLGSRYADDPTDVNQPPERIAERTCYAHDDFTSIERRVVNGVTVDLWCGDRLIVFDGGCWVQRGLEFTEVACVREK